MFTENDNINYLDSLVDLVIDEYSNYYRIVRTKTSCGKLLATSLSNYYYDDSYAIITELDVETKNKYDYKHIGHILTDRLNDTIKTLNESNRKIFTVQDLLNNQTEVSFLIQTVPHPRSK